MPQDLESFFNKKRVLITGGAGFIGSTLVRRLLTKSTAFVFNLDKLGYASSLKSIDEVIFKSNNQTKARYKFFNIDLCNFQKTQKAINDSKPDIIFHLAAESHVDSSIIKPSIFVESNINGTFNLLESVKNYFKTLDERKRNSFRFHHISTDEVFGSLGFEGYFDENSPYKPNSPYSASKAASDHLVMAWRKTFKLPTLITNCSNNYGPWQYPEKLIPKAINNALKGKKIPLYGNGENVRDWLFVEDHIDALLVVAQNGIVGESYCIGGNEEKKNKDVLLKICEVLDSVYPSNKPYSNLIENVCDRKGHDFRYAINSNKIKKELKWKPKINFEVGIKNTINWYLKYHKFC